MLNILSAEEELREMWKRRRRRTSIELEGYDNVPFWLNQGLR